MAYDIAKLDELRRRYASAAGGDMYDPHFKAVAAQVFADADTRTGPSPARRPSSTRRFGPTV